MSAASADTDLLARRARRVRELLDRIDRGAPEVGGFSAMAAVRAAAAAVEAASAHTRCAIALLGPPQVGKTATLVNVLGRDARGPFAVGAGMPTTHFPVRTRLAAGDAAPGRVEVHYFDPAEYQDARAAAVHQVGLDPAAPNAELIDRIHHLMARTDDAHDLTTEALRTVHAMLQSYDQFGARYVKSSPVVESGTRVSLGGRLEPGPARLVREVRVFEPTGLPPTVELIDLPGLGEHVPTGRGRAWLRDADAVVLFVRCSHLASKDLDDAVRSLTHEKPLLRNRLWLVAAGADTLPAASLADGGFLETLSGTLNRYHIAPARVCFVSNFWHKSRTAESPEFPSGAAPELAEAFREAARDGGIGRLRTVLFETIPREVGVQNTAAIWSRLNAAEKELAAVLRSARAQAGIGMSDFPRLVKWRNRLIGLVDEAREPHRWNDPAGRLDAGLTTTFAALLPTGSVLDGDRLRRHHELVSTLLATAALQDIVLPVFDQVAERVGRKLQSATAELGPVPVGGHPEVPPAWAERVAAVRADLGWAAAITDSFRDPPLFRPADPVGLTDRQYRALMGRKIRLVAQQLARAMSARALDCLEGIAGEVDVLLDNLGRVKAGRDAVLDELIAALEDSEWTAFSA